MKFVADKVKLSGPRIDGNWSVTFDVGEYQKEQLKELIGLPTDTNLKVTVELFSE